MIKYDKRLHSFSYDGNPNSSEMPSIEDVKQDKYGDVIIRMVKLLENASISSYKFNDKIDFGISIESEEPSCYYPTIRNCSLKQLFKMITDVKNTLFYKKSYDEVRVMLDLRETDERPKQ